MATGVIDTLEIEIVSKTKDTAKSVRQTRQEFEKLQKALDNISVSKLDELKSKMETSSSTASAMTSSPKTPKAPKTPKQPFAEYGSKESQLSALKVDLTNAKEISSVKTLNSELTKYITTNQKLVTVNQKTKDGLTGVKVTVKDLNNEVKNSNSVWSDFTKGISGGIIKLKTIWTTLTQTSSRIVDVVQQAGAYEEGLNLFRVTLGEYFEEGDAWVKKFSDALYLDPANVMQYMGAFNSVIKGLGVGADNSYLMSKNLTQLAYDLASFKNISIEEAFRKLQSATSGKIICLIRKGLRIVTYLIQWKPKHIMV